MGCDIPILHTFEIAVSMPSVSGRKVYLILHRSEKEKIGYIKDLPNNIRRQHAHQEHGAPAKPPPMSNRG
jgi:hypothetical protein